MGCLATRMVMGERQLIPIAADTRYSLEQWAAFSLRYVTAWSNWHVAYGTYRLQVSPDELAAINVWGWGGGVTLAELQLARLHGAKVVMLSASAANRQTIEGSGVVALDHQAFGDLFVDLERLKSDADYRQAYRVAEAAFVAEVEQRTSGRMVQIFCDYIGTPVYRATVATLAREGVITTAGWKEGMEIGLLRAKECINRHQHIHTHYARYQEGWKAVAFAEGTGWLPKISDKIYSFDEIPALAADYERGETGYFPIFSINT